MASRIVGRCPCPECGFQAAHLKESDKTIYRYCPEPECQAQYFPRTDAAKERLRAASRPVDSLAPTPAPATPAAVPVTEPPATPPAADPATAGTGTGTEAPPPPPPPPRRRLGIF